MSGRIYDFIGIGIGPFNLSLACLAEPVDDLDGLFIERAAEFDWHGGTLLQEATLQTPFLCDLVSLADPTSRFSLMSYMKATGQIYSFYAFLLDTQDFFLPRNTFNAYYRWAAGQLHNLLFGQEVTAIEHDTALCTYRVRTRAVRTGEEMVHCGRKLVLGSGTAPAWPDCVKPVAEHAVHSADYLSNRKRLKTKKSITVIGSGQSAAEIFHDLLSDIDRHGYRLTWVIRSPRLIPRELTKQTLQMTSPDYADYFFSLDLERRARLIASLRAVYQGINPSLINDIFDLRYRKMLTGQIDVRLVANTTIVGAFFDSHAGDFELEFEQAETGARFGDRSGAVVCATGYHWPRRRYLDGIAGRINWTGDGHRYAVARNCSIDKAGGEIFVPNAEIHPQAFIPPDLGQACYRNSVILRELVGGEVYPVERSTAFQTFRPEAVFAPGPSAVADAPEGAEVREHDSAA